MRHLSSSALVDGALVLPWRLLVGERDSERGLVRTRPRGRTRDALGVRRSASARPRRLRPGG